MATIEIDIPRPFLTLGAIGAIVWIATGGLRGGTAAQVSEQEPEPPAAERVIVREYVEREAREEVDPYADRIAAPTERGARSNGRTFYYSGEQPREKVFYRQSDAAADRDAERTFYTDPRADGSGAASGSAAAEGGPDEEWLAKSAEDAARAARERQAVLSRSEEILRYELSLLEQESFSDPAAAADLRVRRQELLDLLADERAAEAALLASLRQVWDANGFALALSSSRRAERKPLTALLWPIEPLLGISAHFHDEGYEARFGFDHRAIDIPAPQGSTIYAPADGTVAKVSDNGYGYSSVTIDHGNGMATLYGHVSGFLVREGQSVRAGEPIALSGGTPGTKGAGRLTTGAHLHFEVYLDGDKVDPLEHLVKDERAE